MITGAQHAQAPASEAGTNVGTERQAAAASMRRSRCIALPFQCKWSFYSLTLLELRIMQLVCVTRCRRRSMATTSKGWNGAEARSCKQARWGARANIGARSGARRAQNSGVKGDMQGGMWSVIVLRSWKNWGVWCAGTQRWYRVGLRPAYIMKCQSCS